MEIILTTIYTLAFLLLIYRMKFFRIEGVSRVALAVFFVIKVFCGIALIFIYSYYYTERTSSDIYNYFDDGNRIYSAIDDNPADYLRMLTGIESDAPHLMKYYSKTNYWFKDYNYELFNDNRTIIRYNAFVRLFSFGYIEIHTVVMAFLSFAGLCGLLKVFLPYLKNKKYLLVPAVFAFPSVLFWSSGVLKEGLVIFSSGLFVYAFHRIIDRFSWKYFPVFLLSGTLLFLAKFYILVAAIPGLISLFWIQKSGSKRVLLKFILVHALCFIALVNSQLITGYDFPEIISKKQGDFINFTTSLKSVGSFINIPHVEPTAWSIIKNSPNALYNAFFRPTIFEINSPIMVLSALENLFILLLLVISLVLMKRHVIEHKGLFCFCISFVLIVFLLCGLTTPVLGALVRYKVPALPFLLISFIFIVDIQKIDTFKARIYSKLKS